MKKYQTEFDVEESQSKEKKKTGIYIKPIVCVILIICVILALIAVGLIVHFAESKGGNSGSSKPQVGNHETTTLINTMTSLKRHTTDKIFESSKLFKDIETSVRSHLITEKRSTDNTSDMTTFTISTQSAQKSITSGRDIKPTTVMTLDIIPNITNALSVSTELSAHSDLTEFLSSSKQFVIDSKPTTTGHEEKTFSSGIASNYDSTVASKSTSIITSIITTVLRTNRETTELKTTAAPTCQPIFCVLNCGNPPKYKKDKNGCDKCECILG